MTVPLSRPATKTVVILGAAYAGRRAAQVLSQTLPADWRLVVIDRNSHFNHVYVFPRYCVIPSHAPKAFVPYTHAFEPRPGDELPPSQLQLPTPPSTPTSSIADLDETAIEWAKKRVWVHGEITRLSKYSVTFKRLSNLGVNATNFTSSSLRTYSAPLTPISDTDSCSNGEETIDFDYCMYCLGATLPSPVDTWISKDAGEEHHDLPLGCKRRGVAFMEAQSEAFKKAGSIIAVGGGALGIQLATDLKAVYPEKDITLIHSRKRMMPIYPIEMHEGILSELEKFGITVILGERVLSWPENPEILDGRPKTLQTSSGRALTADLVLPCTGQKPVTLLMGQLSPYSISTVTGRIKVHKTLQVDDSDDSGDKDDDLGHIFACGDCAETGSIQAGHTAYHQGELAAHNIVRLIMGESSESTIDLKEYVVTPPAIKVTLGLSNGMLSNAEGTKLTDGTPEDLYAPIVWQSHCVGDLPYDES